MKQKYYDGTKLLSSLDINGNKPEIYICTSNRSAGKTTYFARYCVNRFLKYNEKFMIIYRFNYELDDCADKFYKDISNLFFKGSSMSSKRKANGIYHELYLTYENKTNLCGYAISLNSADQLKKYSHLFSDTSKMLFDEFQSETNHYCSDEIKKFISIHTSVARGNGEQVRYLPVYMIGNPVSLINPYYIELGISNRLKKDTKILKGDGFVLEQGFNKTASQQQKLSGFNRAFANNSYVEYASQNIYLNDNQAFIEKMQGNSIYIATIRYNNNDYAIREFADLGIVYCDDRADTSYSLRISISTNDHNINYVMLNRNSVFLNMLRNYFDKGCFRFKNLQCKEAVLKLVSYR